MLAFVAGIAIVFALTDVRTWSIWDWVLMPVLGAFFGVGLVFVTYLLISTIESLFGELPKFRRNRSPRPPSPFEVWPPE
jgi:hypothetical protein